MEGCFSQGFSYPSKKQKLQKKVFTLEDHINRSFFLTEYKKAQKC